MIISLDTETNGLDVRHGAKPYLVTICESGSDPIYWEWPVDPLTRAVEVVPSDLAEIIEAIGSADEIVMQNGKFDVAALAQIVTIDWPWHKTHDTLIAAHLLASNEPHNLTDLAANYLGAVIEHHEIKLRECVLECRRQVQHARLRMKRAVDRGDNDAQMLIALEEPLLEWRIAEAGLPEMPSAKETTWKYDGWLPLAMRKAGYFKDRPEFDTVLADYACADSSVTVQLWEWQKEELKRRDLWEIYLERMKLVPIIVGMEARGITVSGARLDELETDYRQQSEWAGQSCVNIAKGFGYELNLPKSGNNKSLLTFCFDKDFLALPVVAKTDAGNPSLDAKVAIPTYLESLEGVQLEFVEELSSKRKLDTSLGFTASYRKYWLPTDHPGYWRLHSSLNQTGTDTLRFTSNHPNSQQVSKLKDKRGRSMRYAFGPAPDREWWSLDFENIEMRIPAYESGETELISVFENPDEAPFYGSYHLAVFSALWPKEWAKHGTGCKEVYKDTLYQWTKNFDFLLIYGGQEALADLTAHKKGAYALCQNRYPKIFELADYWIKFANKHGYVETLPDRTLGCKRGYPLLCTRTQYGRVKPTVPLNYHVSGSAMWCTARAMVRCAEQLAEWNEEDRRGYHMVMQVHDEMDFDFPKGGRKNLPKVMRLKRLMEQSGDDIGIPLKVSVSYHPNNWSESVKIWVQ